MRFSPGPPLAHAACCVAPWLCPRLLEDALSKVKPECLSGNSLLQGPLLKDNSRCKWIRFGSFHHRNIAVLLQQAWHPQSACCALTGTMGAAIHAMLHVLWLLCRWSHRGLQTFWTKKPHVQSRGNLWPRATWCGPGWFPLQGASSKQRRHEQVHTSWHQDHSLALFYLAVKDYWTILILGREKGKTNI